MHIERKKPTNYGRLNMIKFNGSQMGVFDLVSVRKNAGFRGC